MSIDMQANKVFHELMDTKHYRFDHDWGRFPCPFCGCELGVNYLEDRLYAVRCKRCEYLHLTRANKPKRALQFASFHLLPKHEFCEEKHPQEAAWWSSLPIEGTAEYFGSPLDVGFPDELRYFVPVPFFTIDEGDIRQ